MKKRSPLRIATLEIKENIILLISIYSFDLHQLAYL